MKTVLFSFSILLSTLLLSDELSWVNEQIQAIKPPRSGISQKVLNSIETPFLLTATKKEKKNGDRIKKRLRVSNSNTKITIKMHQGEQTNQTVLSLGAIINNSAMINGKWYKIGNTIDGYKIRKIGYNFVLLSKHRKQRLLSTKSHSKTIKFQK